MTKYIFPIAILAAALTGCPVMTTSTSTTDSRIDVPAAIELLDAAMQRRVDLTAQALQWGKERDVLTEQLAVVNALPKSSTPDPRIAQYGNQIREKSELIANNLALLNADDTVALMLIKSAIAEFKAGDGVTIKFVDAPQPDPAAPVASVRPGAVAP